MRKLWNLQRFMSRGAISNKELNNKIKRNDFYNEKKCEKYAIKISEENLGKPNIIYGKNIYACPHTQNILKDLILQHV